MKGKNWSELKFSGPSEFTLEQMTASPPWKITLKFPNRKSVTTDLSFLKPYDRLGELVKDTLYTTFTQSALRGSIATIYNYRTGARMIFNYLLSCRDDGIIPDFNPTQITTSILGGYASWLLNPSVPNRRSTTSLEMEFNRGIRIIVQAAKLFPNEFRSDLVKPVSPFSPRRFKSSKVDNKVLPEDQYDFIRNCAKEIVFKRIQLPPNEPPERDELWPFFFYILIETTGNADPISELTRDCLTNHAVESNYQILNWIKRRSKRAQYHLINTEEGPVNLSEVINYLLAWTSPLANECDPAISNRLFLYRERTGNISALRSNMVIDLDGKRMKPPDWFSANFNTTPFRVRQLRETKALLYFFSGKGILDIQDLLQHGSLETTRYYLSTNAAKLERDRRIDETQKSFQKTLNHSARSVLDLPLDEAIKKLDVPTKSKQRIRRGEFEVGLNGCKDPFNSPFMAHKGQLCTYHRACLDCPNAFFTQSHLPTLVAERNLLEKRRETSTACEWAAGPAETILKLKACISQFSDESIREAEKLAESTGTAALNRIKANILTR